MGSRRSPEFWWPEQSGVWPSGGLAGDSVAREKMPLPNGAERGAAEQGDEADEAW